MDFAEEQFDFTVAIPTYNGAARLPEVLDSLKEQLKTENIRWEIIVVDNNSTDQTAEVVRRYQKKWRELRYAFEPTQGAAHARQKAVLLARSPLVGFLDDDNLPAMVWISEAYKFAQEYPRAGVISSRIRGRFEGSPPKDFERIAAFLALTDRGHLPLLYAPEKKVLPPSAGMVVRRHAWLDNIPQKPRLCGRNGKSMLTGEDLEAILHIQSAGWEVWYNPAMQMEHKIPAQRLTRDYLMRLMGGIGLSRYVTRMLSVAPEQRVGMLLVYILNDIRKVLFHGLRHGFKVWTDPVAAAEMALYTNSLISPFFFWREDLQKSIGNLMKEDKTILPPQDVYVANRRS